MITVDTKTCDVCGACVAVCPCNALCIVQTLEINHQRCSGCLACVQVCPCGALSRAADAAVKQGTA
jgi:ferredoxin